MAKIPLSVILLACALWVGCSDTKPSDNRPSFTGKPNTASPPPKGSTPKPTTTPTGTTPTAGSGTTSPTTGVGTTSPPSSQQPILGTAPSDPLAAQSWHLKNTGQTAFSLSAGTVGVDTNVTDLHANDIRGADIVIAVSDDGIETSHEDLRNNYLGGRSKDFMLSPPYDGDPQPYDLSESGGHGTAVTGIIAAQGWNDIGSRGIAPNSKFIGFNLLAPDVLQSTDQQAMQIDSVADVYNYSYGTPQCAYIPFANSAGRHSLLDAYRAGVTSGRNRKGSVYLKAAGNSYIGASDECDLGMSWSPEFLGNANFEEQNNYPYLMIIGALDANGSSASYSTPGSNLWVSGFGGEYGDTHPAILTTDLTGCTAGSAHSTNFTNAFQRGTDFNSSCQYTSTMNGTSSATPTVAGVAALVLGANPNLGWRDVKYILAATATVVDPNSEPSDHPLDLNLASHIYEQGWVENEAGFRFHNYFGFGMVNAKAAVDMAMAYSSNLGPIRETIDPNSGRWLYSSPYFRLNIPNSSATGVSSSIDVRHNVSIEAIQIKVTLLHPYIENIGLELTSPSGTKSIITNINSGIWGSGYYDAVFLTNAFLGEKSLGHWTLKAIDGSDINPDGSTGSTGSLINWQINAFGHSPLDLSDKTPPAAVTSLSHANAYSSLTSSPVISFSASSSSDILRYEISLGTTPGASNIHDWASLGTSTTTQLNSLILNEGARQYVNIRAVDTSENFSAVTSSGGWIADSLGTQVTIPSENLTTASGPNPHQITGRCEPGAVLTVTPNGAVSVVTATCGSSGVMTITLNNPERLGQATIGVTQTDQAGNVGPSKTFSYFHVPRGNEQLALGDYHACSLDQNGVGKCWGKNSSGQLGLGIVEDASIATTLTGLTFKTIAAGSRHSCGVTTTGQAYCWGANSYGQIGDGTDVNRLTPTLVVTLPTAAQYIVTGATHSCALTSTGGVKCWGDNSSGGLGDGTTTDSLVPVDVTGLTSGVKYIFSGRGLHTCALTNAGGVKCWGDNSFGQLGNGTTNSSLIPVNVLGLTSGVEYVYTGGYSSCAKLFNGSFRCWGENSFGQLGNQNRLNTSTPTAVSILTNIQDLSLGEWGSCALKKDDTVSCWGYNTNGQLNSVQTEISTPRSIPGDNFLAHRSGMTFHCGIDKTGSIQCRGLRTSGQTGEGTEDFSSSTPSEKRLAAGSTSRTREAAVGVEHMCYTTHDHKVYCAGSNDYGEVGDGRHTYGNLAGFSTAFEVLDLSGIAESVSIGDDHSCVLTVSKAVSCWGSNRFGQLGDGWDENRTEPAFVNDLPPTVVQLTSGSHHNCVLLENGGVKCWGRNDSGQLGDGTGASSSLPVNVTGLTSGVISLSSAGSSNCAVLTNGEVRCWGRNLNGQLGDNSLIDKLSPVMVSGLNAGIATVSVGDTHACSVSTTGAVKCWGNDSSCQLGSNSFSCNSNRPIPQDVFGLSAAVNSVKSGKDHSCALMMDNALRCWGSNRFGQLGFGVIGSNSPTFTEVTSNDAPNLTPEKIYAGGSTSCLIDDDDSLFCWGDNSLGQRGDGLSDTPLNLMYSPTSVF